jgi:hypothetical protein
MTDQSHCGQQFTDFSFAKRRLSTKMLRFVIEAAEFRIAAFMRMIEGPVTSQDDGADAGHDRTLLMAARDHLLAQKIIEICKEFGGIENRKTLPLLWGSV